MVTVLIALSILTDVQYPQPMLEGVASYYSIRESGTLTASGEHLNDNLHTCAMRTGNFGEHYTVVADNGRSVTVKLNDRGPYIKGRVIDLSEAAMRELTDGGLIRVKIYAKD